MKKIAVILFCIMSCISISACSPMGAIFGEITFIQDSINPLKFYFKVKTRAGVFCSFQTDSCQIEWTCATGLYGSLPLVDTLIIEGVSPQFPVLIYGGWHTFDSIPPDSLEYVTFITQGRANAWNNLGDPAQTPFAITVTLNFAYLAHHTGVRSAYFNAPMRAYGVAGEVMYFDPQIQSDPNDSLWVTLAPPEGDCNSIAGIDYPTSYHPSSHNVISIYHPTGFFIWDKPPLGDANTPWDIAYLVSGYRDGMFAYSIMRDMIVWIESPSTGISDISNGSGLKCYPSPASGNFTIDMTGYDTGEKQIRIYNGLGQTVYQTISSKDKLQVGYKLASGVYTVTVTQNGQYANARIVVQ